MAAVKDKIVNIPISDLDITSTVQALPKTPLEGGLIEVKLKRKSEYKNAYHQAFIDPTRLIQALQYLKQMGNPHYQFFENIDNYEERCRLLDPDGSELLFPKNQIDLDRLGLEKTIVKFVCDDSAPPIKDKLAYIKDMEDEESLREEMYYRQHDTVRKFQIDYDESVCLTQRFPEAFTSEETTAASSVMSVAPGEGKLPENILCTENWDALAFPMKHPTGEYNLHFKRDTKLSDQYYFVQRLRNRDRRFSADPPYIFAAFQYLEKKQFQRNINVSFMRGKKSVNNFGDVSYRLEDGFNVFDNTSNTPKYWQTAKYEMIAKLNNLGPFAFFFTLSSADLRWDKNFTTVLRERNTKIVYEINGMEEATWVEFINEKNVTEKKKLRDYLENVVDESFHELIRRNVMVATRNYKNRFDAFIKEIVMHKSNPMCIEYWSAKLEFQGRGAPHNHGVLWADFEKLEHMIEYSSKTVDDDGYFEYNLKHLSCLFSETEEELKGKILLALQNFYLNGQDLNNDLENAVKEFGRKKLNMEVDLASKVFEKFKFFGIRS